VTKDLSIIDDTGGKYDEIIFSEDYVPSVIYKYQIKKRDEIIRDFLKQRKKVILDMGCGSGFHLSVLKEKCSYLIASDISYKVLLSARKKYRNETNGKIFFVVCNATKLPFKNNSIDFTLISGVLHHIPSKIQNCLDEVSRIIKSYGEVLINEPNYLNLINHINMTLSKADPTGKEKPLKCERIRKILIKKDFRNINAYYTGLIAPFTVPFIDSRSLSNILEHIDRIAENSPLRYLCLRWTITAKRR
jgi:ubiquinone/menaquinone biosynthesis C-methylase UbiE